MGIFDDARNSLKKYSGLIIDKTENLAKQAKISLEINNLNERAHSARADLGSYILKKKESGKKNLSLEDDYINEIQDKIKEIEKQIHVKRQEVSFVHQKDKTSPPQDKQ